jgi:hypothetical protein
MDDLYGNFMAITAVDRQTAEMYLEMCQYDMDAAIQMFFENGGDVTSSAPPSMQASGNTSSRNDELFILFGTNTIPEAWRCQGLALDYFPSDPEQHAWAGLGVVQVNKRLLSQLLCVYVEYVDI